MSTDSREERRRHEQRAQVIAALATEVDTLAERAQRRVRELEELDAEPNEIVAVRRAVESLVEVSKGVRRDGLLSLDQQQLL